MSKLDMNREPKTNTPRKSSSSTRAEKKLITIINDREEFEKLIRKGYTIKQLMQHYNCSRTTVTSAKKHYNLVGISPNSLKRDNGDGTKTCNKCNREKPLSEFYSNGATPSGTKKYKPDCKDCSRNRNRKAFNENLHSLIEALGREYKCESCGYCRNYAALTFHHKSNEKNFEFSRLGPTFSFNKPENVEKLVHELSLCSILCANCHAEEHSPELSIGGAMVSTDVDKGRWESKGEGRNPSN